MNDWFDYKGKLRRCCTRVPSTDNVTTEFTIYKWLRANTIDRFTFTTSNTDAEPSLVKGGVWKERLEAEEALKKYLADLPSKAHHV